MKDEYLYHFGVDIAKKYGTFETASKSGITFEWSENACHVSGTSSTQAIYTIYDSKTSLPDELNPGDWLMLDYQPSVETVNLRYYIAFWKSGDTSTPVFSMLGYIPRGIVVPDAASGMTLQIRVPSSTTIDRYISRIRLLKVRPKMTDTPRMISIIDDDTSGLSYVQRYHDACRHNGVFGNYAVLTKYAEQNQTMKDTLLAYEDEGFGMLIHAYRQSSEDPWQNMGADEAKISQCRAVLAKGLRQMREFGFINYNYWVTPYGVKGPQIVRIAKELGVECLISTNNYRYNDMMAYNPYYIKRVALHHNDSGKQSLKNTLSDVKSAIDAAAASNIGSWLIITTHFNEWSGLPWDDSSDENGYPVGYERFNDVVQYALKAGLDPVTFPEGWAEYKHILQANKTEIHYSNI